MIDKISDFLENSFLSPLIKLDGITDISYNGKNIFYMHNIDGRKKSKIKVSQAEVLDFIRQLANFSERQFSYTNPFLDISIGKYRLNAVHTSLVRVKNEKTCSFAIRIGSEKSRIKDDDDFMDEKCRKYLTSAIENFKSIVISGPTGSGKTELQKHLLLSLKEATRVIVIDNIQELEAVRANEDIDLTMWQISPNNPNANMQELIRNALRSNPDWLVVAEARGKEMNEILNSAMTGHPIITTLHSTNLESTPLRICRMVEMAVLNQKHEDVLNDIKEHLQIYVYLEREFEPDGSVHRYIESIGEIQKDLTMKIIYKRSKK